MQITIEIPDELAQRLNCDRPALERQILEALVVQGYQSERLTSAEVGRILNLPSRWDVEAFLKQHHADLHYDESDLEQDLAALDRVLGK
jgi:predicted HTH domain antitoxin